MRTTIPLLAAVLIATLPATAPAEGQVTGTLQVNEDRTLGTHPSGQLLLFTPDPLQPGSSVSHWDPFATPNLLMEPFLGLDLPFLTLDVTPSQMEDIGWTQGTSTFNIFPLNGPGEGFDDPTPFAGAPGNPATTLGEARANLFNAVLGSWGATLESPVDIDVLVLWLPLFCDENLGATLGAASTVFIFRDDPAFPQPQGVWYHAALAEALIGDDVTGPPGVDEQGNITGGDLIAIFNSDIDNACLGAGTGYYYGLDGEEPPGRLDLASVLLHELGHGLGFANFTDEATGEPFQGFPNIYDLFTFDHTLNLHWDEMTNAQRRFSATNTLQVTWDGENANDAADGILLPGVPELVITAPAELAGTYAIGPAEFGPPIPDEGLTGDIACFKDAVPDATFLNGCTPATNPGELAGKIALIDRGGCPFVEKVANAQAAGAIGALIVNNAGNNVLMLGGDDPSITIPAASLGRRDGNRIRQAACGDTAAFLNDDRFQVTALWATSGSSGEAVAVPLTDDTAYFYFFDDDNVELIVKVLDACNAFDHFWVFAAGLTNVEVDLTVVDTQTGVVRQYNNPLGTPFAPIQDTEAFATCP